MTHQERSGRFDRNDPNLLLAYLQYALADVRSLSERSGRHLELAISTLIEDTSVIDVADQVGPLHRRS
jgi:hypothetical protein